MDYNKIKLIIWDLDETFWNGTLSEGEVTPNSENIDLIKKLACRGIVSSICSKNDYDVAWQRLVDMGVNEYFVFPSINWEPKGKRVAAVIKDMALRAENVLFIDDSENNLREAVYYCAQLMTATPDIIPELINIANFIGKDDSSLSRLHQYKILENKHTARQTSSSNEEFLRESRITVELNEACIQQIDRVYELVCRTNQLNYTKRRDSKEQIEEILSSDMYQCGYVTVSDNFGEYGIVGFYTLKDNELIHFLFSCRIMGMGVEQYVYAELGFPKLNVVGEVAVQLNSVNRPSWINKTLDTLERDELKSIDLKCKVLFKGPCDMESVLGFLKNRDKFDKEFSFVNSNGIYISAYNTTVHLLRAFSITAEEQLRLEMELPFWDSTLFASLCTNQNYDAIFLSVFADTVLGCYKNKEDGKLVMYGDWFIDYTDRNNWFKNQNDSTNYSLDKIELFTKSYKYIGRITPKDVVTNLKIIRKLLPTRTKLIVTMPTSYPYIDKREPRKNDRHIYNRELINLLRESFGSDDTVKLIDYTKFANKKEDFLDSSNHFTKRVYYEVAEEISEILYEISGEKTTVLNENSIFIQSIQQKVWGGLRKNKTLVKAVRKIKKFKNGKMKVK